MPVALSIFLLANLGEIYYHRIFCFLTGPSIYLMRWPMKLAFAEIPQGKSFYTLNETHWFPADEIACSQPARAEIEVWKRTNTAVFLKGELQFTALLACDRCGIPVERRLDEEFEYIFSLEEQNTTEAPELECSDEDCKTFRLNEPVIDVDTILREQVFLAIPVRTLCTEDCKGLCPGCGAVLNSEICSCSSGGSNSPFAVLERLRKA